MINLKRIILISTLIGSATFSGCQYTSQTGRLKNTDSNRVLCESTSVSEWEGYGGGKGTATDPYLICTPDQFQDIRGDMMDKRFFRITQDLDFSDKTYYWGWRPTPLGVIDGGNHKLKNITIDYSHGVVGTGIYNRLIKDLNGNRDEIRNLIIENVRIIGNGTAAPGGVIAAENNSGVISNVHVFGAVVVSSTGSQPSAVRSVGGLVGTNEAQIVDSSFEGEVTGEFNVGGIAGLNSGTIENSAFSGTVRGVAGVGGIVGVQLQPGSIEGTLSKATGVSGERSFGEMIGLACSNADYEQCSL